MPELLPTLGILGVGSIIGILLRHVLGKPKTTAETHAIHSSIASQQLKDLKDAIELVGHMRVEMDADKNVISSLKQDKIDDDRKIQRRDGIIEEQRREIRELHDEVGQLRAKCVDLERRLTELEGLDTENIELTKQIFQLKGERETQ